MMDPSQTILCPRCGCQHIDPAPYESWPITLGRCRWCGQPGLVRPTVVDPGSADLFVVGVVVLGLVTLIARSLILNW